MDELRQRVTEDLSGLLSGEVRCDPLALAMYASDASLYQITPLGVVFPRNRQDVVNLARYATETSLPLIPRGAGSGVAGESVGSGLIVDFSRHMAKIERIDAETVRVQPGVVLDSLNRLLREYGRYFPPDPAGSEVTTVGSMLALDAAGSHAVRVGSTRDHVQSMEVVLAGGTCFEAENESLEILKQPPRAGSTTGMLGVAGNRSDLESGDVKRTIISKLAKLLSDNELLINQRQPATLLRNRCGYFLRGVVADGSLNLARMLVGSEGTLGMFTAATLHTSALPAHRGVVLLLFGQLETAIRAVREIAIQQPSACDLLDRRLLTLAREADSRFADLISPSAEAALIVEQTGFSDRQARDRIAGIISAANELASSVVVAREAYSFDDVEFLWSLPRTVVPLLTRLRGRTRPLPFVEDVAVPPDVLYEFLVRAQKVFQKNQVTATLYAHAASGQLHLRPFLAFPEKSDVGVLEAIARDLYQVVFSVGGTISGEHGAGLSRTAFIRSQYGPLYRVFQQVKDLFDPHNLLNPGKIISDDPHVTIKNVRPVSAGTTEFVDLQLRWNASEMAQAASACNGCGKCKTQEAGLRMCPFFRMSAQEEASPRSKANVMRNIAAGLLNPKELTSPEMERLGSFCFNCKQCELECPSNVDIPHLMIEAKAAYVASNGLSRTDWLLTRAKSSAALGCTLSLASNWAINNPGFRWFLEKTCGIARHRKLPPFARRSYLRSLQQGAGSRANGNGTAVALFVDHYANFHDPELPQALVAILKHNGIRVIVPPGQVSSGMAMISAGDLDAARDIAERNIRELAEMAREGIPIVCTEPAAALCLKYEYPKLLDHPDVEVVASKVIEAGAYLQQLRRDGNLRTDFQPMPLNVGYHTPCHLRALGTETPFRDLLALIPDLQVHTIEEGCSGMAGTYGFSSQNFQTSIRIGWGLIRRMRQPDIQAGTTECSSCKIQMEQGTTTPTVHPLKLIALAYGLMPELRQKLRRSRRRLTVT